MAAENGKRSLEEIFEEHLAVTKAGFERVDTNMNEGFRALRTELVGGLAQVRSEFRSDIEQLRSDLNAGFTRLEGRFDNLLVTSGSRSADHEDRITALEADVAKLKAG